MQIWDPLIPILFKLEFEIVLRDSYENKRMEVIGEETIMACMNDNILILDNIQQKVTHFLFKLIWFQ